MLWLPECRLLDVLLHNTLKPWRSLSKKLQDAIAYPDRSPGSIILSSSLPLAPWCHRCGWGMVAEKLVRCLTRDLEVDVQAFLWDYAKVYAQIDPAVNGYPVNQTGESMVSRWDADHTTVLCDLLYKSRLALIIPVL